MIPKKYSIFIQTDKPVYNPGDELLYRVLVLDSDLKPYRAENITIDIVDAEGNSMLSTEAGPDIKIGDKPIEEPVTAPSVFKTHKHDNSEEDDDDWESPSRKKRSTAKVKTYASIQRSNGKIFDGLYAYHYNIIDEANSGIWSLKVTIDNETDFAANKSFEVKEYILPRFQVIIETNREASETDSEIVLTVHANYTFGELVGGEVTVTPTVVDLKHKHLARKKAAKSAKADFYAPFKFQMKEELNIINAIRPYEVTFDVEFVEGLTGQKLSSSAKVRVYKSAQYFIDIKRERKSFKPGFPYSFSVDVKNFDGQPAMSQLLDLRVDIKYLLKTRRCKPIDPKIHLSEQSFFRVKQLDKGLADFTIDVPDTATAITITASFNDSKSLINVLRHQGETDEYLIIQANKTTG